MLSRQGVGYSSQSRAGMIVYTVGISLFILLIGVLQVTLFADLPILHATPDLTICAVLCIAFFLGRYAGAITGIGAGFLIEAMGSVGISLLPLFYMLMGYVMGYYARVIIPKRYTAYLIYLLCALCLRAAITTTYIGLTYSSFHLIGVIVKTVLPEAALTAIFGALLYFPAKLLCGYLSRKRK